MGVHKNFSSKKIVIVSHIYATGPTHALENFLKSRVGEVLFIGHPFVYAHDIRSHLRRSIRGEKTEKIYFKKFTKNQFVSLFKDIILTIFWVSRRGNYDLYIGADVFNALTGIVLSKLGFVKKTVFYTIDYIPQRFENPILNNIYHTLDRFCVKKCDKVWNLSDVMIYEREKKGVEKKFRKKQILVPMGTTTPFEIDEKRIKFHTAVHMGHLIEKQGMQLVIEALPEIIKKVPDFRIEVLGGGEYEGKLKKLAKDLEVLKYIKFYGFIKNHSVIDEMLPYYAFGYAPYTSDPTNYIQYTDPGKVKAYLSSGLPIIITNTTSIANEIERSKAGLKINYTEKDLIEATVKIISSKKGLLSFRKNAILMAKKYTWEKIFSRAISASL